MVTFKLALILKCYISKLMEHPNNTHPNHNPYNQ